MSTDLWIRVPTFEELGLEREEPSQTYLSESESDQVWIGSTWDIANRGGLWDVYRKGNHMVTVEHPEVARLIVASLVGDLLDFGQEADQ